MNIVDIAAMINRRKSEGMTAEEILVEIEDIAAKTKQIVPKPKCVSGAEIVSRIEDLESKGVAAEAVIEDVYGTIEDIAATIEQSSRLIEPEVEDADVDEEAEEWCVDFEQIMKVGRIKRYLEMNWDFVKLKRGVDYLRRTETAPETIIGVIKAYAGNFNDLNQQVEGVIYYLQSTGMSHLDAGERFLALQNAMYGVEGHQTESEEK